jgi:(4S)-4-hydroxy-5-phosphonooxypentane-2,3-dione isomerase
MICLGVNYVIRAGHEDEAEAILSRLTEATRAEPGCRMYLAHRLATDRRQFYLYEQYDDEAALEAHRASPHFEALAKNKLWPITESRQRLLYELLS